MTTSTFFQDRSDQIYAIAEALDRERANLPLLEPVVQVLRQMLQIMGGHVADFDAICTFSIQEHGNTLDEMINNKFTKEGIYSKGQIEAFLVLIYEVVSEFYFNAIPHGSGEWNRMQDVIDQHKDEMSVSTRYWLGRTDSRLPAKIVKSYFHEFKSLKLDEIRKVKDDWDASKTSWDKDIGLKETRANRLRESFERAEKGYNFVGLVRGFRHLRKQKESEQCWSLVGLGLLALLLFALPLWGLLGSHGYKGFEMEENEGMVSSVLHGAAASKIEFSPTPSAAGKAQAKTEPDSAIPHVVSAQNAGGDAKTIAQPSLIWLVLLKLLPLLTLEIIVLYFFRIVLAQYRSVKAQILQLDLRMALCQFIESYTKHMVEMKKDAPDVLQKFESLIFSGLMTDGEKIPSVLDGTEQLANLIRSIQGKGSA